MDNNPEIWVEDVFIAQASELIRQLRQAATIEQRDWVCADCGEGNPANFELCWQCGAAKQLIGD